MYHQDGAFAGASTVLLGLTPGDGSATGVGQRTQAGKLEVADRTTPAGRFESLPGKNLAGEHVMWIAYFRLAAGETEVWLVPPSSRGPEQSYG